ncbi:putative diphthamide biosynthesis protein Dph2 [Hortaea werneckii]|uniref:2-(3-amino-3-carboxypropyl)histidine synthase subunit 2 n=2 Tax=Hortaea werneckii TaxID=91943 RepID=A0A3M7IU03_HORWE|nr:putative diphthamide biosynthesis protein Dph2 [Hortaea werneckii]OTA23173.1 hypothetical protein BTJ68_15108 [Hortaea werneckii EXF-2000]KAI6845821.1 putative diphthamide biosynthesis protein Dph2 [Hortaea werneckii]KAI6903095.1 putative diphthamide biosynthesis protein Dph2 [Hortaea werneckii]KAI6922022.1 putative diphthamide biosynthesis protein Dph2 [Hortaea werneckii]
MATSAPVLSTPAEHVLEEETPIVAPTSRLSNEQLYLQYEIKRTVSEIREGRWKRIALQFPDEMLVDAPRVFESLRDGLREEREQKGTAGIQTAVDGVADAVRNVSLEKIGTKQNEDHGPNEDVEETLCILADTSYGACCVDEVAAEHVEADVVVHYGRACLSPTARLPVIYVFTSKPLDIDASVASFEQTYLSKDEIVCLMADIPYSHHLPELFKRLCERGFSNVFQTEIVRNPASSLPNRTLPKDVEADAEKLKEYSIFHVSSPPTSLQLILSSRVKSFYILPTDQSGTSAALEASTAALLRRRYALTTQLSTVSIFGILINTLSVSNYMGALKHCQDIIKAAGKKSYVFVVGKVNAAKVANFSEIGGWVVIGCWESSLIESKEFYRPIITPFELEVALTEDKERVWSGEWVGDFSVLLGRETSASKGAVESGQPRADGETKIEGDHTAKGSLDEEESDDEPPEFDLRTGRYVSQSRPMGRTKPSIPASSDGIADPKVEKAPASSALVQRAKGDLAVVNGAVSPAAQFLREKRTWQGLGSDYEISYERDENGKIRGAAMEEGRAGVAKGYSVGDVEGKS